MGAYLSSPITEKHNEQGTSAGSRYVVGSMQGWRRSQEDAHVALASVEGHPGVAIYGVFDGHGGAEVARFCAERLAPELVALPAFSNKAYVEALEHTFHHVDTMLRHSDYAEELERMKEQASPEAELQEPGPDGQPAVNPMDLGAMLKQVFQLRLRNMDGQGDSGAGPASAADTPAEDRIQAGCTAVVAVHSGNTLFVANAGDSRAILCRAGTAVALSEDHKPASDVERCRIVAAGGYLSDVGGVCRVNGNLNLSRAIGDLKYKCNTELQPAQQIITAQPDVTQTALEPEDEFFLIACDGVWDVMTNQMACDFVRQKLAEGLSDTDVVNALLDACLASDPREARGVGCDNMTALIVCFERKDSA